MLRLVASMVYGALVGAAISAFSIKVLGVAFLGASTAYILTVATGIMVGLVAGTPVWKPGAWLEAVLKAIFGVILACVMMYGLRSWATTWLDLSSVGLGRGAAGYLPAVVFPVISVLLATGFGIDSLFGSGHQDTKLRLRVEKTNYSASLDNESEHQESADTGASKAHDHTHKRSG